MKESNRQNEIFSGIKAPISIAIPQSRSLPCVADYQGSDR